VLVPLGGGALMVDLMVRLALPVMLVARAALGTINHSLLSIEALRRRGLTVHGVVMVGAQPEENAEAIARLGGVRVLGLVPWVDAVTPEAVIGIAGEIGRKSLLF
jgi:dethiobiotin synthetase